MEFGGLVIEVLIIFGITILIPILIILCAGKLSYNEKIKTRRNPRFLICHYMLELRSKPCFKRLLKKPLENPQNFRTNTPLYFGEAFEIPKDFSRKVLCVGVWGRCPNIHFHTQKARQCRAFYFS